MRVTVGWTPAHETPPDTTAVIIDVLRATTTLTVARAHGAGPIRPAVTLDEAFALKRAQPEAWLCGEREGRKVEGFDCGNSPFEYMDESVSGRTLIFASTNGSQAMRAARRAQRVVLAAFINVSAVVAALRGQARVQIVCAGKLGTFALEDAALAGWLCERLALAGATLEGAAAQSAVAIAPQSAAEVRDAVRGSRHGRYLRRLGPRYARDIELAARLDVYDQVSELQS